jgi:hypothetical protein
MNAASTIPSGSGCKSASVSVKSEIVAPELARSNPETESAGEIRRFPTTRRFAVKSAKKFIRTTTVSFCACAMAACGSGLDGTYTSATGLVTLDLRSGGKASLTMMGGNADCTYGVDGKKLNLSCNGEKTLWNIHDDGSITGPGFVGTLSKKK